MKKQTMPEVTISKSENGLITIRSNIPNTIVVLHDLENVNAGVNVILKQITDVISSN